RRRTRLVGLVPGGDAERAASSQCTVLVRSELTPEGFRDCLTTVAAEASAPAGSAGRPGPLRLRAARADAGNRLRRALRKRGTVVAVVAALAAGAFGPTGKAE